MQSVAAEDAIGTAKVSKQLKQQDSGTEQNLENYTVTRDLAYVTPTDSVRVGDLYLPKNKSLSNPAVIFIHGGGWNRGKKEQVNRTVIALAKHGFAVFNINYRLVGEGGEFPADLIDVKDALGFLASKASTFHIDTGRIIVMGGSAGAHLAMMLAYTSNNQFSAEHYPNSVAHPIAAVSWFGPIDLSAKHPLIEHYLANAGKEGAKNASPLNYAATAVPTLFVHGTDDPLVPFKESKRMAQALEDNKIESKLIPIPGAKHGFKDEEWTAAFDETVKFLDTQFKFVEPAKTSN